MGDNYICEDCDKDYMMSIASGEYYFNYNVSLEQFGDRNYIKDMEILRVGFYLKESLLINISFNDWPRDAQDEFRKDLMSELTNYYNSGPGIEKLMNSWRRDRD